MKTLRYECSIENFPGFRADAVMADTVYEVLIETKDARRLRTTLMDLARVVSSSEKIRRAVLVLEEPGITDSRLQEEWQGAASVIRPEIFSHLSAVIRQSGKWSGIPSPPLPAKCDCSKKSFSMNSHDAQPGRAGVRKHTMKFCESSFING